MEILLILIIVVFHASDPDGYGAGEELDRAIDRIQKWAALFPVAKVCIGNHDAIVRKKRLLIVEYLKDG